MITRTRILVSVYQDNFNSKNTRFCTFGGADRRVEVKGLLVSLSQYTGHTSTAVDRGISRYLSILPNI